MKEVFRGFEVNIWIKIESFNLFQLNSKIEMIMNNISRIMQKSFTPFYPAPAQFNKAQNNEYFNRLI